MTRDQTSLHFTKVKVRRAFDLLLTSGICALFVLGYTLNRNGVFYSLFSFVLVQYTYIGIPDSQTTHLSQKPPILMIRIHISKATERTCDGLSYIKYQLSWFILPFWFSLLVYIHRYIIDQRISPPGLHDIRFEFKLHPNLSQVYSYISICIMVIYKQFYFI